MARWGWTPRGSSSRRTGPVSSAAVGAVRAEHFLYVGDDEPRKNIALLLEATRAIAAGRRRARSSSSSPGARGSTRTACAARRAADLALLLGGAAALVQPALYEGFGLTRWRR